MSKNYLLMLSIFMPLTFSGCQRAYQPRKSEELRIAPQIYSSQFDNGLSYYLMVNKNPSQKCSLRLNVNVGSIHEEQDEMGMAHFVEHMAFHAQSVSQNISLVEWFQKNGMAFGPDANAFTSNKHTVYKIELPNCDLASLTDALKVFRSFADGLSFGDENISREKNVINAEERETNNNHQKAQWKIYQRLWSGTRFSTRPVLGTTATRTAFNAEKLTQFYQKWYQPRNMTLVLVGDFNAGDAKKAVKEIFSPLIGKAAFIEAPTLGKPDYQTPIFSVANDELAHVEAIFAIQSPHSSQIQFRKDLLKDRLAYEVALSMLGKAYAVLAHGESSTIRRTLVSGTMFDHGDYEFSLNVAGTKDEFASHFKDAYAQLMGFVTYGFSEAELATTRDFFLKNIEQWVSAEKTWQSEWWTHTILAHIQKYGFANSAADYQYWIKPLLGELTVKDCQDALRRALDSGNQFFFALGPIEESERTVKSLTKLLEEAKALPPIKPLEDAKVEFQYQISPCSQKEKSRQYFADIETYQVNLGESLRLVIKKTDFMKDQVVFRIFTDQGYLTMDRKDVVRARMAQNALPIGGLLKHSPKETIEIVKDKLMSVGMALTPDRIVASGSAEKKDFPFALEYTKAFIDHPLYAESALRRVKEQVTLIYQEREHDLWKPIMDDFNSDASNHDPRVKMATKSELLSITRDELLQWHKQFISSKPLHIIVVGDVDVDDVVGKVGCVFQDKIDLQRAAKKKFTSPVVAVSDIHKKYIVKSKEEKANVAIRYPLMFGSDNPQPELTILQSIVEEVFRLKMREKRQITYFPHVVMSISSLPEMQSFLQIQISVPKADAQKAREDMLRILHRLAQKGVTVDHLQKAKAPYITHVREDQRNNYYWANRLSLSFNDLKKISSLQTNIDNINAVSTEQINALLRKYFSPELASSAIVESN